MKIKFYSYLDDLFGNYIVHTMIADYEFQKSLWMFIAWNSATDGLCGSSFKRFCY